jgi:hypothetical protein
MSSAAARQRAYRRRETEGRLLVSIEVGADDIELLIAARVLDSRQDHHSREAIAAAIQAFLKISRDT